MCSCQKSIKYYRFYFFLGNDEYYRLSSRSASTYVVKLSVCNAKLQLQSTNQVCYNMPQQALPDTPHNPEAQLKMGERYASGQGVQRNGVEAVR